jgi:NADPH-dependent 2,4-dienoyl-CoA reductase/sulfur reductase-like enzyme/nitrite reductase/ring-hydroxylating ferredoxin subunit
MAQSDKAPGGPDLAQGVPLSSLPATGVLAGHVGDAAVLLSRQADGIYAVSGTCTHYGAPLAEGLVVDGEIRCPWHHACFSLRSGRARRAPAFAALATWRVEIVGDRVYVRGECAHAAAAPKPRPQPEPQRIVIVGGGAAAYAAADRLRGLGYGGSLTLLSADAAPPCDRPNLSKDYLAGTAPEDWIPLQAPKFYQARNIDLRLDCEVTAIPAGAGSVLTRAGEAFAYDALLLATGAEPVRLPAPWASLPNVHVLRSLADARAIVAASAGAKSVALIGAGFIGMEAAGALRSRGLAVHVVARDAVPLERVFGRQLGDFITGLHRQQGVAFHLQAAVQDFDGREVQLDDGTRIAADLLIVGVGVKPRTGLAEATGLAVQDGILVDAFLQTSAAGIFAAGDVARYRYGADLVRIEHWVHAQRQGQAAAANMLGARQAFAQVPFFWTHHQGVELRYTGHAEGWDEIRTDGELSAQDFTARFLRGGKLLAAASIGRDRENLAIEAQLERELRAIG